MVNKLKVQNRKKISIFFSSTFLDMQGERDALVTNVLPVLRERLYKLQIDLVDIDLRWGVLDYENETQKIETNKWHYCKKAIDSGINYFVGILGQRYGSPQEKKDFQQEDFLGENSVLSLEDCIGKSLTEIEILHATNNFRKIEKEKDKRSIKSLFLFRSENQVAKDSITEANTFPIDEGQESLKTLKTTIHSYGNQYDIPVRTYSCRWNSSLNSTTDLEQFSELLIDELWNLIFKDYIIPTLNHYDIKFNYNRILETSSLLTDDYSKSLYDELENAISKENKFTNGEAIYIQSFISEKSQLFEGRTSELAELQKYITSKKSNSSILVYGESGLGKTSLLAHFQKTHSTKDTQIETICISRYIGINKSLVTSKNLLKSITDELDDFVKVSSNYNQKEALFKAQIEQFSKDQTEKKDKQLVIIIDAVNQLEDVKAHTWIPTTLPANVKIIVSSTELLSNFSKDAIISLSHLKTEEKESIIQTYLSDYGKALSSNQIETLSGLSNCGNPLYLLVLLNELRTEHTVTDSSERLKELSSILEEEKFDSEVIQIQKLAKKYPTTASLFEWVLQKCERFFNHKIAEKWFSYLITSKSGASLQELNTMLQYEYDTIKSNNGFLIARYIRPYLMYKENMLFPYHSQFFQAIKKYYLDDADQKDIVKLHYNWSSLMLNSWKKKDKHALKELPYHLNKSERSDELYELADDDEFLKLQVTVLGEIELPQETQQEAMSRALKDKNGLKTVEFLSKPFHMRAANISYTPLKALEGHHIEYALSIAENYAPQQTSYWYIILAWKLYTDNEQEKVAFVLKKFLEKPYITFTSAIKNWILPNAIDYSGEKVQNQNEWICKPLVTIIDKHELDVLKIVKLFQDESLLLLFIKHLATEKHIGLATSLLPKLPKNASNYFKTVLTILKNTIPFDNQLLNSIKKTIAETKNYWVQCSYRINLAKSLNKLQKYDESLVALNPIAFDPILIPKKIDQKPFTIDDNLTRMYDQINIQLKTIIAYKSLLELLDNKNNLEESQWENIQQRLTYLYTNIPSELIRKSNEETNYTDDSIKGNIQEMLREFVNEGLVLIELLYTLEKFDIAEIIENKIRPYVSPTVIDYLKFKGKIALLPNSISNDLLGGLIEEAFDFDSAFEISSALLLLIRFIKNDKRQKAFVNFTQKIHLILNKNDEFKIEDRWLIFMNKERAFQLANKKYYNEALSVVLWMLRYQWRLEFEPNSKEVDKEIFEFNGHGYSLLRELSVIITNKKEWKILNEVAHYFDESFRGKWILHNALMNTEQPKKAIDLAEEILVLENWSLLYPKSTDSIQLNEFKPVYSYTSENSYWKSTKKELKQKISFLKWLCETTSGEKYTLVTILSKLFNNLKLQNGRFNGLLSYCLLFTVLLPIHLIIKNTFTEVPFFVYRLLSMLLFTSLSIYLYRYMLKNSPIIAYDFFKNSSLTFTKIKRFNINVFDEFEIEEFAFFEFSRMKKPEKSLHPTVNFHNKFNFNFNHPQRVFVESFKKLVGNILYKKGISSNEINILEYVFENLVSYKPETYNDYIQRDFNYKDPGYAPAIRTVSFGEYDELLLTFIETLGKKKQYRRAFNWIKKIQDSNMGMKARLSLAYIQASNDDYLGMKWTLENDIKKYNPSGTAYSSSLNRFGNTMVSSFAPRILEELVFENKADIAKKLIQLESNEEYKTNFEIIIKKAENEFAMYQQIENTETSTYSDNWLFDKVPFIEIKYDQSIEGKINSLCLQFKNHLRKKEYDKVRLLVQKVENIEIRNILRISYLHISKTHKEDRTVFFNETWKPFKGTFIYENTALPSLLNELFPWMNTWYRDANDKNRWMTLLIVGMRFYFPNKNDCEITKLIKTHISNGLAKDEVYFLWTKHSIENLEIKKAFQLFHAISIERSHQFIVAIFHSLKEANITANQLFLFLKYCQSNPKLLYKAIQGLSAFFPEKVDELLVAIGVEGNRIDTYTRKKKEIDFENKAESFKGYEEEMKVFLTAGETLIQHNEIDKAIYYYERVEKTIKFISFTEKTEELFERKSRLNVSILKAMYKYDLAYQEYNTLPIPNTDLNRAFHYSELAMILLLKYERQEAYLEDLKIVLKNACIAFKNIERELRFSKSTLHTDYAWTKIHIIFGRVAYQLGLNDRAGILLMYGSVIDKEKQPYLHLVADLLIEKKDYKGALYLTERDIENQSHYSDGIIKKLETHMFLGDFEKVTEIALYYLKETDSVIDLMFLLMLCIAEDQMGIQTNPYAKQLGEKIELFSKKEFYYNYLNCHHLEEWINRNYHDGHQVKNLAIQVFSFFTSYKKEKTVKNSLVHLFTEADILIDYHELRDKLIRADYPSHSFNFMG